MLTSRFHGPVLSRTATFVYLTLGGLFALLHLLEARELLGIWAASYGDDILCLPLVLGVVLIGQRALGLLGSSTLAWPHVLFGWVLFMVYFEGILPRWTVQATADPWDLAAYTAGLILFQVLINRPVMGSARVAAS